MDAAKHLKIQLTLNIHFSNFWTQLKCFVLFRYCHSWQYFNNHVLFTEILNSYYKLKSHQLEVFPWKEKKKNPHTTTKNQQTTTSTTTKNPHQRLKLKRLEKILKNSNFSVLGRSTCIRASNKIFFLNFSCHRDTCNVPDCKTVRRITAVNWWMYTGKSF